MRKRGLSAVLALILALSMSFSSFAEESNAEGEAEVVTETDDKTGEEAVPEETSEEETAGEEASGEEESEEITEEETIAEEAAETEEASEGEETATDEDGEEAASEEDASEGSDEEDAAGEEAAAEEESEAEAAGEEALEDDETAEEESEEEDTGDDDGADAADLYEAVSGKTYVIEGEDGSAAAEVTLTWEKDTFGTAPNAVRIAYVTDTTSVEEYYEEQGLEVIDAAGVDITFYAFETDEDGNAVPAYDENGDLDGIYSVQPVSGQTVTVSITLSADQALETETSDGTEAEIVIVHEADDGTLTELEADAAIEATEETVTFEAESFSIYYTVTLSDGTTIQYDYSDYIEVDEDTKTITVSQSGESAGYEIQAAINYIAANYNTKSNSNAGGWTIVVSEGTYSRFFISEYYATALEGLTVEAADGAEVVIGVFDDSATPTGVDRATLTYSSTPDVGGVYVNVTGVTLSGLTFQYGTSTGYTQWYASAISTFNNQSGCEANDLTISDCNFYGQGERYGFMVCDVKVWTIEGCTFDNLAVAISFMEDNVAIQATIKDNTITNCDDAILESYAGGTPSEGTSYYLIVTGNKIYGTASAHTRVCIMNEYKNVNSLGTVNISGNTFEHANILLDCIDTTASDVYANNTIGECSWVLVTTFGHVAASITDADKVVTFYASTELGYWELTSTDGISEADLTYIQGLIKTANASGVTTLTVDMTRLNLEGSSLKGYLSGGVKHLKKVLNWVSTTSVTVNKIWDDEDDADGIRPDSVTIELYQNGESTGKTVTLSEDNDWTATFSDWSDDYKGLPIHSSDGTTDYTYTVAEDSVSGYSTSYAGPDGSNEEGWSWTVTNTHEPEEETTTTTTTTTTTSGSSSSTTTETSVVLDADREVETVEAPAEEPGEVLGAEREVETIAATGDDSDILFWLILMLAAGAGIGSVLLLMHPRQRMLREGNSRRRIP